MTGTARTWGARRRSAVREFGAAVATIMTKELRSRMRGRRAFVILTLYLALLALIAYNVYLVVAPVARTTAGQFGSGVSAANASSLIGTSIFSVLSVFQLVLVAMIAPAFTAGQISLEREKQTLDLLITTPMRPGAIVIGKLFTALAFVVLMIVSAIPITAIVLMYGGASVGDIVRQQVVLLSVAAGVGAIGLFASALVRRTQAATVISYCAVMSLVLGTAMIYGFWTEVARQNAGGFSLTRSWAPEQLRWFNPMIGMLDVVSGVEVDGATRFTEPLYQLFGEDLAAGPEDFACDVFACAEPTIDPAIDPAIAPVPDTAVVDYWWPRVSITLVALAALLTAASMRLVVPAGRQWRIGPRRPWAHEPASAASRLDSGPLVEELGDADR